MKTTNELITPALAADYLKRNNQNRPLRDPIILNYSRQMSNVPSIYAGREVRHTAMWVNES